MKRKKTLFALLIFILLLSSNTYSQIKIVSGLESEIYNQFAKDIKTNTEVPITIFSTKGSVENFERLIHDSIHIGFMQYDVLLYQELENNKINEHIKIFLPLYDEEIHLITLNNSKINSLSDLHGKKVGVGTKGAGSNITAQFLKIKSENSWTDYEIPFKNAFKALLADSIDAFFYVGAAPSNSLRSLSKGNAGLIKLVPIENKNLDNIYIKKTIKAGTYSWLDKNIKTYSTKSLLVVNTNNFTETTEDDIDLLYNNLTDNLSKIRKKKQSHPKWQSVTFDLENIDWPVYKQEYINAKLVFNLLAYIAAILTFIQIYLMINKLWKRKHEKVVAESISVSALFISFTINSFFGFKNAMNFGIPQLSANIMWIIGGIISFLIGIGFWVAGSRQLGLWKLLLQSLKLESQEAGELAKAFFRPSAADKIMQILGQIAIIDDVLDKKEKEFIQHFADAWNIEFDWDSLLKKMQSGNKDRFRTLRKNMLDYLGTTPPPAQVTQLGDAVKMLVYIDDEVAQEEELILGELQGLIASYLGNDSDIVQFNVAAVPQSEEQDNKMAPILKDLKRENIAGGIAYISEPFYSKKYAEIMCNQYRDLGFFTVVI